jgi:hypothetical protein
MSEIWSEMYMVFIQSTRYSCHILMRIEISREFFAKHTFVKFLENGPIGAEFFHSDRKMDDITKLIIAFRNFANTPNNTNATKNNSAYSLYECHTVSYVMEIIDWGCLSWILRRIFGAKKKEVTGSRLVLRSEKFRYFYCRKIPFH